MSITSTLADFAVRPLLDADGARALLRLSLFDWAVCGMAARPEPVSAILRAHVADAPGAATVFGAGRPARPAQAALANGVISHALDYDDTHFAHIGHLSVAVLPAALAMAEVQKASLPAMVDAALIGVETAIRVGVWLGRAHALAGYYQTATAGAIGASLAAGRLAGLNAEGLRMAMAIAAGRSAGLRVNFGTMGKSWSAGLAAETGIEAALLARAGLGVAVDSLDAFGATHHGQNQMEAFAGLGEQWRYEGVIHKFHACCHGLHAMIEALTAVKPDPARVSAITVQTHPRWLGVCDIAEPANGLQARFSYALTAAMALRGVDTAKTASFSDDAARDPALIALRDRVTVAPDNSLTEMQARVKLTLRDGQVVTAFHDLDAPRTFVSRRDRLMDKARALIGKKAKPLADSIITDDLAGMAGVIGAA